MREKIRSLIGNEFFRNVATLMTGSTIAQLIALAIYPILTDIYTPGEHGLFSLYMGIIGITGLMSTGRYQAAILMPTDHRKGLNIAALGFSIALIFSLFLLIIVLLFKGWIARVFNIPEIENWLLVVPLSTLLIAFFQVSVYWHNRNKKFRSTAAGNLVQSITNSGIKLSTSGFIPSGGGLILGSLAGQVAGAFYFLWRWLKSYRSWLKKVSRREMVEVAKEYYRFPGFNLPNNLINNISNSLPVFLLGAYFGAPVLGLYSLGFTMIFRPMNLVTLSMEQVFSQRMISRFNEGKSIIADFGLLLKRSFQIGFLPFLLVGIFGPVIFAFVFGEEWETSGKFTQLLIPWFFTAFLANQLTFLPDMFNRQMTAFFLNIARFILRIGGMAAGILKNDVYLAIGLFSIASFIVVIITLIWYVHLVRSHEKGLKDNTL